MLKNEVIAIFDVGKTNKKLFLINEDYKIVFESSITLPEIEDEDGDPCEDIEQLSKWIKDSVWSLVSSDTFAVRAVNFTAYGASFVHLDVEKKVLCPLYNYLKPDPDWLNSKFYGTYGPEQPFSIQTCSPALGNLNSGMQLFRLKYEKPELFKRIKYSLHLPQYLSALLTNQCISEITSIGCHTNLWDFNNHDYHHWIYEEKVNPLLPEI